MTFSDQLNNEIFQCENKNLSLERKIGEMRSLLATYKGRMGGLKSGHSRNKKYLLQRRPVCQVAPVQKVFPRKFPT